MKRAWPLFALLAVLEGTMATAQSEEGVYSSEGVQVRSDARVHALFAVLNDRGFDREAIRGPEPTRAARYHEQRVRLRQVLKLGVDVQKQADAFVAAHPDAPVRYLRAVLALEDAPRFGVPDGESLDGYGALAGVLAAAWSAGAADTYDDQLRDYRKASKDLLGPVDEATAKIRALLRMDGSAEEQFASEDDANERVVVVYNPLDSHGTQLRHHVGNSRYVVLGPWQHPTDKGVMDPLMVELARAVVGPDLRRLGNAPVVAQLHSAAGSAAAAFEDAQEYALEALSRAVARRTLGRPLVLKTGDDLETELPAEPLAAAALEAFSASQDTFAAALPGLIARAAGSATTPAPTPPPGPAQAAPKASGPPPKGKAPDKTTP
jgi:hypothetical protein